MPAILTSLIVFTTGCLSAEMKVAINDDDTADIGYTLLVDVERLRELAAMLGSALPDTADLSGDELVKELFEGEDPCADLRTTLTGREVTATDVTEGERRGVRCTATAVPLTELTDLGDDTALSIVRSDSTTTVDITLQDVDSLAADGEDLGAAIGSSFAELLEISFVVSAPGTLGDNNATSVNGATATWLVTPDAAFVENGDAQMRAVWSGGGTSGGGVSAGVVAVIVLLGVMIVGVLAVVLRRRGSTPNAGDSLPPPPAV